MTEVSGYIWIFKVFGSVQCICSRVIGNFLWFEDS